MSDKPSERVFRVADRPGYHTSGIPWEMIASHEKQARINHGQSIQRLHDRGGLAWGEALAVLEDRPWKSEPMEKSKAAIMDLVAVWLASRP
jgi:hypothetical protein